jgi:hypothetical protein
MEPYTVTHKICRQVPVCVPVCEPTCPPIGPCSKNVSNTEWFARVAYQALHPSDSSEIETAKGK